MTTILVTDDSPVSRRTLSMTLRAAGFEVVTAQDGQEALTRIEEVHVDLALLDLDMPVMDGIIAMRRIRGDSRFSSMPVIILTASDDDADHAAAREAGVSELLTKPTDSRGLIQTVKRLLA